MYYDKKQALEWRGRIVYHFSQPACHGSSAVSVPLAAWLEIEGVLPMERLRYGWVDIIVPLHRQPRPVEHGAGGKIRILDGPGFRMQQSSNHEMPQQCSVQILLTGSPSPSNLGRVRLYHSLLRDKHDSTCTRLARLRYGERLVPHASGSLASMLPLVLYDCRLHSFLSV